MKQLHKPVKVNKFDLIDSIIQDEPLRTKKYQNVEMVACTYNDGEITRLYVFVWWLFSSKHQEPVRVLQLRP
ncbi:hypothetical protein QE152_g16965 [Popillia japonica]|uniref:Uncharacterized protein n=1 Tax=Popillia japonica TaxID=7064 RepID=A0AAW1L2G3_POPJA